MDPNNSRKEERGCGPSATCSHDESSLSLHKAQALVEVNSYSGPILCLTAEIPEISEGSLVLA